MPPTSTGLGPWSRRRGGPGGEFRGLGSHPAGRPWRVGIGEHDEPVALVNQALATSSGRATRFERTGQHHHLFDALAGRSAGRYASVSIVAGNATAADALSTALAVMRPADGYDLLRRAGPARAILVGIDGTVRDWRALT